MVSVIVKIAAVTFELLHGASACLPLPATVTQILSLQEVFSETFFKIPKTHLEDAFCYIKQGSEMM